MDWYPEDSVDGRAKPEESYVFNSRNLHNFCSVLSDIKHESVLYFIKLKNKDVLSRWAVFLPTLTIVHFPSGVIPLPQIYHA